VTKSSPSAADRWAVSARASGGIVTAGVTLPTIELALLGIPPGFTPTEIQTWLRDLAGVAIETSRTDGRDRPIPPLLHHALTGLLFSQTELWSHTGHPLPCAAVFVQGPQGAAFGWVGSARVVLLVNGEPYEPQWVIVRDETGQEAMSAALPPDSHALLTLEYWPSGEGAAQAPASLDAEYGMPVAGELPAPELPRSSPTAPAIPPAASTPAPVAAPPPPAAAPPPAPVPAQPPAPVAAQTPVVVPPPAPPAPVEVSPQTTLDLPTQQPGLAPDPTGIRFAETESAQTLPSTRHPSASTFAIPQLPGSEGANVETHERRTRSFDDDEADDDIEGPPVERAPGEAAHPVGRWLQKLMGFSKKREPEAEPPARPVARIERTQQSTAPPRLVTPQRTPGTAVGAEPIDPSRLAGSPLPPPDIEEPHALPGSLRADERPAPRAAAPGLAAAGFGEILGGLKPSPPSPKVQGLTAVSSPTGPTAVPARGARLTPEAGATPAEPYPALDVKARAGAPRGPIHIEREPVGADKTFAIPRLPQPGEAPRTRTPQPPPATTRTATPAPQPPPAAPNQRDVPEPPAEFLEQFAASASSGVQPGYEPEPEPQASPAPPRPAAPARPATPQPAARTPGGPPPLPSALRAAAQAQVQPPAPASRPLIPPAPAPAADAPAAGPEWMLPASPLPAEPPLTQPVLHAPTAAAPVPVAESEVPALLREIPLPAADEIPDGVLVAQPATPRPRQWRRNEWPEIEDEKAATPLWRRPWFFISFFIVFIGIGWVVGHSQAPDNDVHATPMTRVLRTFGLGGARFTANVDTDPPGAWIAVDGKDLARQTPATLELVPGEHAVTLSMPDLGQVQTTVRGKRGQKVHVNEALHGSLDVVASDPTLPVQVSLDGAPQGFLPVHVDKLPPGLHELQFSGPKMQPWAQNVNVLIRQNTRVVSKPMMSPATGQVQVLAQMNDENGTAPLSGASVFVDGTLSGTTPATIELPRGPHSLRVQFERVVAPIQVIDLPGGNKRFATFQFGLDSDLPPLKLEGAYQSLLSKKPALITATLDGLEADDLREAWLHLRTPDGLWTRYEMTIEAGDHGAVLTVNFPASTFNGEEKASWYLSAATKQGDDFFTEMQKSGR